jgi:hypothetical protein
MADPHPDSALADFLLARLDEDETIVEALEDDAQAKISSEAVRKYLEVWQPDRVLAELDAKRGIVAAWQAKHDTNPVVADALGWVLQAIASPYSEHPDFREEWLPWPATD